MKKIKIVFVCLGNICRSPSAEAVMKDYVEKQGNSDRFFIDSAGTSGWHTGELPDHRMRQHASKRGYNLDSRSRKFYPESDFNEFDMIIGMDDQNIRDLSQMAMNDKEREKIYRMTDFCRRFKEQTIVPDPYFGGESGFETVLDLLEDAVEGLYEYALKTFGRADSQ